MLKRIKETIRSFFKQKPDVNAVGKQLEAAQYTMDGYNGWVCTGFTKKYNNFADPVVGHWSGHSRLGGIIKWLGAIESTPVVIHSCRIRWMIDIAPPPRNTPTPVGSAFNVIAKRKTNPPKRTVHTGRLKVYDDAINRVKQYMSNNPSNPDIVCTSLL